MHALPRPLAEPAARHRHQHQRHLHRRHPTWQRAVSRGAKRRADDIHRHRREGRASLPRGDRVATATARGGGGGGGDLTRSGGDGGGPEAHALRRHARRTAVEPAACRARWAWSYHSAPRRHARGGSGDREPHVGAARCDERACHHAPPVSLAPDSLRRAAAALIMSMLDTPSVLAFLGSCARLRASSDLVDSLALRKLRAPLSPAHAGVLFSRFPSLRSLRLQDG